MKFTMLEPVTAIVGAFETSVISLSSDGDDVTVTVSPGDEYEGGKKRLNNPTRMEKQFRNH